MTNNPVYQKRGDFYEKSNQSYLLSFSLSSPLWVWKNPDYNLNYSLEKIFDPEHYSLSILPWFTTYEETCDILKLDELSEKDYKLEEEKKQKKLTIYNVKLEELHYPFTEFVLFFQKDPIANQTYTLCAYAFDMNFKMSGKTIGAMSEWGNREKRCLKSRKRAGLILWKR